MRLFAPALLVALLSIGASASAANQPLPLVKVPALEVHLMIVGEW